MSSHGAGEDADGFPLDSPSTRTSHGLNLFSSASSSLHPRGNPRGASQYVEDFDLNSEAMDIDGNMSFMDLMNSSPAFMIGDERDGVGRRGGGRSGVGGGRDRGGRGVRGGRGLQDERAASACANGGGRGTFCGGGRGGSRPPVPPSSLPYRAPRGVGASVAAARNDAVLGTVHEPEASNWNEENFETRDDEVSTNLCNVL